MVGWRVNSLVGFRGRIDEMRGNDCTLHELPRWDGMEERG
jgi:hypothetical protein